jgi:hypothetical protein
MMNKANNQFNADNAFVTNCAIAFGSLTHNLRQAYGTALRVN